MSTNPHPVTLEIENLTKIYPGPVTALNGIDLTLGPGMFGLLGPNGAGKTTLMRILAGLLEPTVGSVRLAGEDVLADPASLRRRLGYLPQEFGFYPHLSGEAMLRHLLRLKGVQADGRGLDAIVGELLERVNLGFAAKRKVASYSGGMRQRLGIAQAIAGDPALIVIDEPTAGLDPEERLRFFRLLAELAEQRIVLISTHIVDDVSVLCPRLAVIREGTLLASTTPQAARAAIDGTIFEATVPRSRLDDIHQRHQVTQSILMEGRFVVRVHVPAKVAPAGFEPVPATLEDAYLVLMGRHGDEGGPHDLAAGSTSPLAAAATAASGASAQIGVAP